MEIFRAHCKIETTVAARQNSNRAAEHALLKRNRNYTLSIDHEGKRTLQQIEVADLVYLDSERDELLRRLAESEHVIVTTAVGPGLYDLSRILIDGLKIRDNKAEPWVVLACENPPYHSTSLKNHLLRTVETAYPGEKSSIVTKLENVLFLDTIVDRVSAKDPIISEDHIFVPSVERFRQWFILAPSNEIDSVVLRLLGQPASIITSAEEFRFLEQRKTLLVNGCHLALALFATSRGIPTLQAALENQEILHRIRMYQEGMANALALFGLELEQDASFAKIDELRVFAGEVIKRIREGPRDIARRILEDWMRWEGEKEKLHGFIHKAIIRSIRPIRKLSTSERLGKNPEIAVALLEVVCSMIELLDVISNVEG